MNDKVRAIFHIATSTAEVMFPGVAPAIEIGDRIATSIHPKDALEDPQTELDAAAAAFNVVENLEGVDVGNDVMFRVGVAQVQQGFQTIHAALKDHTDNTPAKPQPAPVPAPAV